MRLVERELELAVLRERWGQAQSGSGSFVLVAGESGIGKTALVTAAAEREWTGARVLWGACDPLVTPRPIGPVLDVADELSESVRELVLSRAPGHQVLWAVCEELRSVPSVLVVDDLQWADEATLDLLRFLLRRIGSTQSMVVGTYRDDEVGAVHPLRGLLGDVARSPHGSTMCLPPLTKSAVAQLADDADVDIDRVHELSGGNPFFATELLAAESDDLPSSVADAVLARATALDGSARDVLELLACAPESVPDVALPALGVGMGPLRAIEATGLVRRGRRGLAFRHELYRLAVASALPPGGAVALHVQMLHALESVGDADPAVLAHHAIAAGDSARIRRYALDAGETAARTGAHTEATAFLSAALAALPADADEERAGVLERLATELYLTDRLEQAIAARERAVALRRSLGDRCGVGANHQVLSEFEWYNANRPAAESHAATAIEVLEPDLDDLQLGHAYATQAYLHAQASRLQRARPLLARAGELVDATGDAELSDRVAILGAALDIMSGDLSGRARLLGVIEGAPEFRDQVHSGGYSNLAYLDVEHRRLREAEAVLATSLPLTIERDIPICNVWQLGARARKALLAGDWDAAADDAEEVLGGDGATLARTWPLLVRGLVSLRRESDDGGDLDAAWMLALEFGEPLRVLPAAAALIERAWLRDERVDTIEPIIEQALASAEGVTGVEWSMGDLAVWAQRFGHPLDGVAVAPPHRSAIDGDHAAAATAWERLGVPFDAAMACADAGSEGAVSAVVRLDRLRADAVADRWRRILRERGVDRIPRRPRAATAANPAGLTPRQVEVVRLLADGATNSELATRLFISPKTADHHVSAVLSKLAVSSRREAVRAARRLGVIP